MGQFANLSWKVFVGNFGLHESVISQLALHQTKRPAKSENQMIIISLKRMLQSFRYMPATYMKLFRELFLR